jgi:hypothetical protein
MKRQNSIFCIMPKNCFLSSEILSQKHFKSLALWFDQKGENQRRNHAAALLLKGFQRFLALWFIQSILQKKMKVINIYDG